MLACGLANMADMADGPNRHEPTEAPQTVRPDGERVDPLIDGVKVHRPRTQQDERGSLVELYHPAWDFDDRPIPAAYAVTINVGWVKGWAVHETQVDRYFFFAGRVKLVLFDGREASPTHGMINELHFGDVNRALVSVPPGVFHAVENTGTTEAVLFNVPDQAYIHEKPDKKTLPIGSRPLRVPREETAW